MLILNRKIGERLHIGGDIIIEVKNADERRQTASIGVDAPKHISVDREEVRERKALSLYDPQEGR